MNTTILDPETAQKFICVITNNFTNLKENLGSHIKLELNAFYEKVQGYVVKAVDSVEKKLLSKISKNSEECAKMDEKFSDQCQKLDEKIDQVRDEVYKKKNNQYQNEITTTEKFYEPKFSVWGHGKDQSTNKEIPRIFVFAASKIPNNDSYSCEWFREQSQAIFDKNRLRVKIMEVSRIPATFTNCRTKSFKIVIEGSYDVDENCFGRESCWMGGLKITRYRKRVY